MQLHIMLMTEHVYNCVHLQQDLSAFPRPHVEARFTNMKTNVHVGKEIVFGKHVDLNVDVLVEVSSLLLSSVFLLN